MGAFSSSRAVLLVTWSISIIAVVSIPGPLNAGVSLYPSMTSSHWKHLQFGDWGYPPDPAKNREAARALFRYQEGVVLIATTAELFGKTLTSSNRYSVKLDRGRVEKAGKAEWDAAQPLSTHPWSLFHPPPQRIEEKEVVYGERRFQGSGELLNEDRSFALSPDGTWLALTTRRAKLPACQDFLCDGTIPRGQLSVEIFNVASGEKVTALTGRFSFVWPYGIVGSVEWLSDRHLLVLTNGAKNGLVGDMRPSEPASDAVWDVVPSQPEILGFWEEPLQAGYADWQLAPKMHVAVRAAAPGLYSLRGNLVDSSGVVVPWQPPLSRMSSDLHFGIQNLQLGFGYGQLRSPGTYQIRDVELVNR